jgi:uncharacterized protein YcgI (DUF1989 family)
MRSPEPCYLPTRGGPLDVDRAFYDRLAADTGRRAPVDAFVVPIRAGRAWPVRAGQVCRITCIEGPQVADLNAWSLSDPRERFWAARTRQLQRAHVSTYDRLWSCLPYLRPMLTIIRDTLQGYGVDEHGGRCHGLLGSRCDPYVSRLLTGESFDFHCHSNLTRAVLPWRLTERDVHDVLNVFQVEGLTRDTDQYFITASPAKAGDYFEFMAEIDLLVAISTCPGGDLSVPLWGPNAGDPLAVCRPLGVEVWQPAPQLLEGFRPPARSDYAGNHGMPMPVFAER